MVKKKTTRSKLLKEMNTEQNRKNQFWNITEGHLQRKLKKRNK